MIDLEKLKARASECQNVTDGLWLSKAADEIEYMRSVFAKTHEVAPAVDAQPVAHIRTDHLQQAKRAPFMCRVHPASQGAPGMTALYATPQSEGLRKDVELSLRALYEDACIQANKNAQDAERYRWLVERFTGYDFDWMPSEPDADDGKSVVVFDVGREFRGGRDITAAIDAALSQHKAGEKDD